MAIVGRQRALLEQKKVLSTWPGQAKKDLLGAAQGFLKPTQGLLNTKSSQAYKGLSQANAGSTQANKGPSQTALLSCYCSLRTHYGE